LDTCQAKAYSRALVGLGERRVVSLEDTKRGGVLTVQWEISWRLVRTLRSIKIKTGRRNLSTIRVNNKNHAGRGASKITTERTKTFIGPNKTYGKIPLRNFTAKSGVEGLWSEFSAPKKRGGGTMLGGTGMIRRGMEAGKRWLVGNGIGNWCVRVQCAWDLTYELENIVKNRMMKSDRDLIHQSQDGSQEEGRRGNKRNLV